MRINELIIRMKVIKIKENISLQVAFKQKNNNYDNEGRVLTSGRDAQSHTTHTCSDPVYKSCWGQLSAPSCLLSNSEWVIALKRMSRAAFNC